MRVCVRYFCSIEAIVNTKLPKWIGIADQKIVSAVVHFYSNSLPDTTQTVDFPSSNRTPLSIKARLMVISWKYGY